MKPFVFKSWMLVLLAMLLSGGPAGADDNFMGLPAYPQAAPIPMQGSLSTNDVPLDAVILNTPDNIQTVMDYYKQTLTANQIPVLEHKFGAGSGYVGYFDPVSGTMRLATVVTRPGGGTMIVLSSMDPRPLVENSAEIPADLPSLPGAVEIATTESRQGSVRNRTVHFTVPGVNPRTARSRLLEMSRGTGWSAGPSDGLFGDKTLVLRRGNETCYVRIRPSVSPKRKPSGTSVTILAVEDEPR
jgi:hypothetical protein